MSRLLESEGLRSCTETITDSGEQKREAAACFAACAMDKRGLATRGCVLGDFQAPGKADLLARSFVVYQMSYGKKFDSSGSAFVLTNHLCQHCMPLYHLEWQLSLLGTAK
ncbi:hypothetical protein HPB50_025936 [Hyalomma asiaticum]|uniref:Uncharacterized protein n=1 Tax=Hyalomma asiaticum TaxID=266040 RepID=A0ACB7S5C3_HYAAI|nr:hypothetical protein HPB50_025936 [Hyalomma asiaticum]